MIVWTGRVVLDSNHFRATGYNISEGSGLDALGNGPPSTRHNAVLRNTDVGNPDAWQWRQESFTSDGGYGGYFGNASSSAGATVLLNRTAQVVPDHSLDNDYWKTGLFAVLAGKGRGQRAGILSAKNRTITLDEPLVTPLDNTSVVTVVPCKRLLPSGLDSSQDDSDIVADRGGPEHHRREPLQARKCSAVLRNVCRRRAGGEHPRAHDKLLWHTSWRTQHFLDALRFWDAAGHAC